MTLQGQRLDQIETQIKVNSDTDNPQVQGQSVDIKAQGVLSEKDLKDCLTSFKTELKDDICSELSLNSVQMLKEFSQIIEKDPNREQILDSIKANSVDTQGKVDGINDILKQQANQMVLSNINLKEGVEKFSSTMTDVQQQVGSLANALRCQDVKIEKLCTTSLDAKLEVKSLSELIKELDSNIDQIKSMAQCSRDEVEKLSNLVKEQWSNMVRTFSSRLENVLKLINSFKS